MVLDNVLPSISEMIKTVFCVYSGYLCLNFIWRSETIKYNKYAKVEEVKILFHTFHGTLYLVPNSMSYQIEASFFVSYTNKSNRDECDTTYDPNSYTPIHILRLQWLSCYLKYNDVICKSYIVFESQEIVTQYNLKRQ